jgi:hypothetical protein
MSTTVKRSNIYFNPDSARIIARFFFPGPESRVISIVDKLLKMPEKMASLVLNQTLREFSSRHRNISSVFTRHYERVCDIMRGKIEGLTDASNIKKLLIGAYFTSEYSIESAAFFNPSMVEDPDQSWKLVLDQKMLTFDNNSLIEVHDTLSKDIFSIPIYFRVPPGQKVIEQASSYQMELGDVELSHSRARNAELKFLVTNTIKQPLLVEYEVLSSEKDGKTFTVIDSVPAADANGPSHMIKTINLSYYNMDFCI